jgi:hypothetical protein
MSNRDDPMVRSSNIAGPKAYPLGRRLIGCRQIPCRPIRSLASICKLLWGHDDFSVAADGCCGGYRIDEMDKKPDAAGCVCAKECHSLNRRHHYQKVGGLAHNQELAVLCASPWRSVHHQSVVAGILVNSEKIMDEPEVPFAL